MATTTNYGWTTPDDTALVKDGASAIRTLGTSIDTTTKNLNPSTTLGDIEYRSSTANTNTRLGIGTSGQYLTVSGGVPAWGDISAGGLTLIAEQQASGASSISFSSIAGTYKQLLLVWSGLTVSVGSTRWDIRLNNSSSLVYNQMGLISAGGSPSLSSQRNTEVSTLGLIANTTSGTLELLPKGYLTVDNYASTTRFKNYSYLNGFRRTATGDDFGELLEGVFSSTSAITSVDLVRTSGTGTLSNATSTSIRLYGLS